MSKYVLYIIILLFLFGLIIFAIGQRQTGGSSTPSAIAPSSGTITAETNTYDFGTVPMENGNVEHTFELKNNGAEPVSLGELYTSCMCTTTQVIYPDGTKSKIVGMRGHGPPLNLNRTIQPGDSFQVKAIFDPAAHGPAGVGPVHRIVYLETNSKKQPKVELSFDALVTR